MIICAQKRAKYALGEKVMCRVAAKKLLNKALQICREHAGSLLQAARLVQSMELTDKSDFSDGFHIFNTCPPSKHFYYHCLQYTEKICFFTSKGDAKGGKIASFRTSVSSCH